MSTASIATPAAPATSNVVHVDFRGDSLDVVRDGQGVWVSVRRVCESLGLGYGSQLQRLKSRPWATMTIIVTVAADGKSRETSCLHLDSLPMWLATIEPSRVSPETREKLAVYQKECAQVLRDHFFGRQDAGLPPPCPSETDEEALARLLKLDHLSRDSLAHFDDRDLGPASLLHRAVYGKGSVSRTESPRDLAMVQIAHETAVLTTALRAVAEQEEKRAPRTCSLRALEATSYGIHARAEAAARLEIPGWG